jgi:hypothetical protein
MHDRIRIFDELFAVCMASDDSRNHLDCSVAYLQYPVSHDSIPLTHGAFISRMMRPVLARIFGRQTR